MPAEHAGDPLRVGVIGCGWAGREHALSVAGIGGARVCGVVDVDAGRAAALATELSATAHADLTALLGGEALDAVIVATPPGGHAAPAVTALEAGVAVFVEKPLARSAADARAIVAAAARTGGVCAVGYQWRASEHLDTLRDHLEGRPAALLVSQGVGPTQARSWFDDPQQSGRLVSERASHHFDLQRAVAGDVVDVRADRGGMVMSGWTLDPDAVEDVVVVTLRFASGAIGTVHVVWTRADDPGRQALGVYARGARMDLTLDPAFVLDGEVDGRMLDAAASEHPFRRQMRLFLAAARAGDAGGVACSAADAAGSLAVALAAELALDSHGVEAVQDLTTSAAPPEPQRTARTR